MARRALNFDIEPEPVLVNTGYEPDWKNKLHDLPGTKFKRNAPPFLPLIATATHVGGDADIDVNTDEEWTMRDEIEEDGNVTDDFRTPLDEDDHGEAPTTPLWGNAQPIPRVTTPLGVQQVNIPRAGRPIWLPPVQNNPWVVRKSIYDQIQWKDNSGSMNLREIAQEVVRQRPKKEKEFKFNLEKLRPRTYSNQHIHVQNNLISKITYANNLREFRVTDSWTRYPEVAVRYFNYNYEKPKRQDVKKCVDGDDVCIICNDNCGEENISSCCNNARTCLQCIESMNDYKCSACRGTLITPAMRPGHIMKIDENIRQAKIIKDNFAAIINAATIIHLNRYPEHETFLVKEGPASTFYDMHAQALRNYEYKEELKNRNLDAYNYAMTIPNLLDIGNKSYEDTKKAYLDLHYGFITNKLVDVWAKLRMIDIKEEKYQQAIMNLETRLRDSGIIENLFDSGFYDSIEKLSLNEIPIIGLLQNYSYIMKDFDNAYAIE